MSAVLPHTEWSADTGFQLPIFPDLTDAEADKVTRTLLSVPSGRAARLGLQVPACLYRTAALELENTLNRRWACIYHVMMMVAEEGLEPRHADYDSAALTN